MDETRENIECLYVLSLYMPYCRIVCDRIAVQPPFDDTNFSGAFLASNFGYLALLFSIIFPAYMLLRTEIVSQSTTNAQSTHLWWNEFRASWCVVTDLQSIYL